eukprot:COSAG05_NODE_2707_length_2743_cov_21.041225_2_plen_482_part_00
MPKKSKKTVERVLVAGLTAEQDELLRTVQYRVGVLAGRDSLYLATRQYVEDSGSEVKPPTKRQVASWLKGEPGMQRQATTGAALPVHKPVAIIRRSAPNMYVQFDTFQLPEKTLKEKVTYTNKKGTRETVPLVQKYCLIMVDAFSKLVKVVIMQTPKAAGISSTWTGLKTNPDVIGVAKALNLMFTEIDDDLQDETPPRRLKDLKLKAGSDNGSENLGPDIERVMKRWNVQHELGQKGRPMSQSLAESHVGVVKRRFASWVRTRMDAVGVDDENSQKANQIKRSWPELMPSIVSSVNTTWMQQHPRPLSRLDVHYGDQAVIDKVRTHQKALAGRRSKFYEGDNQPKYSKGDIVRRMVARSGKLDAAWSKRLYEITKVKQYKKVKRKPGYQLSPLADPNSTEPGLYRAEQLQRVLLHKNKPVQNKLSAADVDAIDDPEQREYVPWKALDRRDGNVLVQWKGFPRADATWEKEEDVPSLMTAL